MYYKMAYNLTFSIKKIQQRTNLTIHMTGQSARYKFPRLPSRPVTGEKPQAEQKRAAPVCDI